VLHFFPDAVFLLFKLLLHLLQSATSIVLKVIIRKAWMLAFLEILDLLGDLLLNLIGIDLIHFLGNLIHVKLHLVLLSDNIFRFPF
jgi:hypothetical protein